MEGTLKIVILFFCSNAILPCMGMINVEFNRNSTGVIFLPYVLNTEEYTIYSIDEIKTMLKVVSTKFSRVATVETSNSATYKENVTYENTYSEVRTAEAAALLNREALSENTNQFISVYVGIKLRSLPNKMHSEVQLAFESVRKSIQIHPGTVLGIILSEWEHDFSKNSTIANLAILEAQKIKKEAKALNLTFGIKTYCDNYDSIINTTENQLDSLEKARKELLLHFDFIICMSYGEDYFPFGINKTIELVTQNVLQIRSSIQLYNPNIVFMLETCISEFGTTKNHYQYQLDFWTKMDQWGTQNNIPIWFHSAFDNPWQIDMYGQYAKYGWWRIKNDTSLTLNDVNAYEEKVGLLLAPDVVSPKPKNNEQTNIGKYIGVISGFVVFIIALALLGIYWIRKNYIPRSVLTRQEINGFLYGPLHGYPSNEEHGNLEMEALRKPYDKSMEIRKNSLNISWPTILGTGEFGVVYKADILGARNNEPDTVALKMTKDWCPKTAVMSILSEIKILSYLGPHENIVGIKGAYTAEIDKGVVYVATELCELGSLKCYLRKASKGENTQESQSSILSIEFEDMIKWSYQIACGMEYLAEKNVIHADLATRNVLLTGNKTAKITDFGLSRRLYDYTNYVKKQQEPLPWRWMAIEALKRLEFSSQSDVWSYGVTLWEIFSMGDVPYPGLSWTLEFVDSLENGLRMKCPVLASPEIYAVMSSCWIQEPPNRPTFTQLKQSFSRMIRISTNNLDGQDNELCYK